MNKKFEEAILVLREEKKLSLFDAIIYYCEINKLEPETAASAIKSNKRLKEELYMEAAGRKMVKPPKMLPEFK